MGIFEDETGKPGGSSSEIGLFEDETGRIGLKANRTKPSEGIRGQNMCKTGGFTHLSGKMTEICVERADLHIFVAGATPKCLGAIG